MAKNLSIPDIAEHADVPLESVRNVYYAKVADPKVSAILKIANVLGVSVNCLMGQCPQTKRLDEVECIGTCVGVNKA